MSDVIYLVSRGAYSDYTVYAAFTRKQAAQEAIAAHAGAKSYAGEFDIEEVPLNPDVLSAGKPAWSVVMDYDTGDNAEADQIGFAGILEGFEEDQVFQRFGTKARMVFWHQCWADNEEHAIKIANERRTQHKAMKGVEHE